MAVVQNVTLNTTNLEKKVSTNSTDFKKIGPKEPVEPYTPAPGKELDNEHKVLKSEPVVAAIDPEEAEI